MKTREERRTRNVTNMDNLEVDEIFTNKTREILNNTEEINSEGLYSKYLNIQFSVLEIQNKYLTK